MKKHPACLFLFAALLAACNIPGEVSPATATPPLLPSLLPTSAAPTSLVVPSLTPIYSPTPPLLPTAIVPTTVPVIQPTAPPVAATLPAATAGALHGPYAIVNVARNDVLNVRGGPGANFPVVEKLPVETNQIFSTGQVQQVGKNRWMEIIRTSGSGTGWVNSAFLTEFVNPQAFCADARVPLLLDQIGQALSAQNGEALAALVSPVHGLDVTYFHTGRTANYSPEEAKFIFSSKYQMNWGTQPASGMEVKGTFHEQVLPQLVEVVGGPHERVCDQLKLGGASYAYEWPAQYRYINFYTLYKPGPAGQEMAWHTWLAGIEYVGGQPYLFSLNHLFWEP